MKYHLKLHTIICAILLGFFATFSFGSSDINNSPETVVSHFYSDYLAAWNDSDVGSGLEKSQQAIDNFTTKHLQNLKSKDDSGADYFTNVQEICPEWVSEITTHISSLNNSKAIIELTLGHSDSESKYKINLVKNDGRWLMDSVLFVSNATGHCNNN
ncbi:DUF3828 domain-containing protein [Lelliottia sp. CFBP8978]|uniref:DUF3828 domain-containing protein n=1 Tax=Lelliottia sp. CFBP8978 TaxID=3096522 RepID=UPI002A6B1219|nr:DUF3828 domain-containing protein [Lelliottia sp. CFBP8978]MDY1038659.1 DUF3828 domain-containing protein [Lelliottia sp. CFBP8978]